MTDTSKPVQIDGFGKVDLQLTPIEIAKKLEKNDIQAKMLYRTNSKPAMAWYKKMVTLASGSQLKQKLKDRRRETNQSDQSFDQLAPGDMFMYAYWAKTRKQLPYWDLFPLIIVVDLHESGDGFYGLNLHYVYPAVRAKLLAQLFEIKKNTKIDEFTKIVMSYQKLSRNWSKWPETRPMFKRYLWSQLRSSPQRIFADEWAKAIFLPTARFVKSVDNDGIIAYSERSVWQDSANATKMGVSRMPKKT